MAAYITFLSLVVTILIQNVYGECSLRNSYNVGSCGTGSTYNEYALPAPWLSGTCAGGLGSESGVVAASDGGGFAIRSSSPFPPSGVSVVSENEYSGILAVGGQLPFLGTAYLEGAVPSAGTGAVTYGCGYGDVRIVNENTAGTAPGLVQANGVHSSWAGDFGYNGCGRGCGCGTSHY